MASVNQIWLRNLIKQQRVSYGIARSPFVNLRPNATPTRLLTVKANVCPKVNMVSVRHFSTSSPRPAIGPMFMMCLKPLYKIGAILAGRGFRKWWAGLPHVERSMVLAHFKRNRYRYASAVTLTGASSYAFYRYHLEYTPITHRRRFILFRSEQLVEIEEMERKNLMELYKDKILPLNSAKTSRALKVASNLFSANKEIPEVSAINWKLTVIDADIVNAVAFPNGDVVVFTGIINFVNNDDELAIIMAHEMSHAILQHAAEEVSNTHLIDMLSIGLSMFVWAILPTDLTAFVVGFIANKFLRFVFELPYSRNLEKEADSVGLVLAAKACFDVRYSSEFWRRMQESEEGSVPEFLSTHPTNENRASDLDALIPAALQLRKDCKCYDLPEKLEILRAKPKEPVVQTLG